MTEPARHAPLAVVEGYISAGLEGVLGVDGEPPARIVIDPRRGVLAVQFPAEGPPPELVDFENLDFDEIHADGQLWQQMAVHLDDNEEEVYALLCAIIDRVQLAGERFGHAVAETLNSLSGILAVRRGLTPERRVGLFGELVVLLALADFVGPADALAAWRGPATEEHDFGVVGADLEVKTTLAERRQHWISTLTQLAPTGTRPLYLISVQLTSAGLGSGRTLPGLVDVVRAVSTSHGTVLEAALQRAGYLDRHADLYRSQWTLRSEPAFFLVGDNFPAITPDRLASTVPSRERVSDVRYRVDLTGLAEAPELFPFRTASLEGMR